MNTHFLKKIFVVGVLSVLFSALAYAVPNANDTVPANFHGFWHFHTDIKTAWNGMHVGRNYVEINYNLAQVNKII